MKTPAFIIGLISGIIGLGSAFITLMMGGIIGAMVNDNSVVVMGYLAVLLTLLIIIFSSMILNKPKQSGILLIGTSIGAIIAGGTLVAITSFLALVAGILAIIHAKNTVPSPLPTRKLWIISAGLAIVPILILTVGSTSKNNHEKHTQKETSKQSTAQQYENTQQDTYNDNNTATNEVITLKGHINAATGYDPISKFLTDDDKFYQLGVDTTSHKQLEYKINDECGINHCAMQVDIRNTNDQEVSGIITDIINIQTID